ncbi:MAG: Gfo/Idh/MocA family oxidoreductase [Planctomycetaceae bacterium]|nr:Gfo/Idh/MocA family oxidoreductase [Planctomycetaceae bacterium]
MFNRVKRRDFLKAAAFSAAAAGVSASAFPAPAFARERDVNSKLNIACIGVGNQGIFSVQNVKQENIVALCDVERKFLEDRKKEFPNAEPYQDFRKMYEEMADKIDAVTVATPDHTHAVAALTGMKLGKHCYCEKPLAHTVSQIQQMMEIAKEKNLVTQMGTQIHAEPNYHRVVELIQSGAVGKISDVHVWCSASYGGRETLTDKHDIPAALDWDLWVGPAQMRPYHPQYFSGAWRCWWAFGSGAIGDMACHYMDLPYWALGLRDPFTIEAFCEEKPNSEVAPKRLEVRYTFQETDKHPAVNLSWHDGGLKPPIIKERNLPQWGSGVIFVGDKGMIMTDYWKHIVCPVLGAGESFTPPKPFLPDSIGHHKEWLKACKEGRPQDCLCHFDYSGSLAKAVQLGAAAFRTGTKLEWDAVHLKAVNCPAADPYLSEEPRKGWEY